MRKTGELSKLFGIDRTTLNYYVKRGLIQAGAGENQYHTYSFEDCMALSFIRYYRGLGFGADEVMRLLGEEDHEEMLNELHNKQEETRQQIRNLKLRQCFQEHLEKLLVFISDYDGKPFKTVTQPYYFIRKTVLENDPDWLELYRRLPLIEFSPCYNPETDMVEISDLFMFSGIHMRASCMEEFSLTPPEGSLFYPSQEKYVVIWHISGKTPEQDLSAKVSELFRQMPGMLEETFVLYLLASKYMSEDSGFDAICFFTIAA